MVSAVGKKGQTMKRLAVLLMCLLLVVLLAQGQLSHAQIPCQELAGDCKLLAQADANLARLTSFTYTLDLNLSATQGSRRLTNSTLTGSGVFALDTAALKADPGALAQAITFSLDAEAIDKASNSPVSQKTHLIIANRGLYEKNDTSPWKGIQFDEVLRVLTTTNAVLPNMADPALAQSIEALLTTPDIIKIERTTNAPIVDGQQQVEFVYTVDLQALLSSKALVKVLKTAMQSNPQYRSYTDDQWAALLTLAKQALVNTTLKFTRWIGARDKTLHGFGIDLRAKFDSQTIALLTPGMNAEPATLSLRVLAKFSRVGQAVSVKAPAGVKLMTISEMFNSIVAELQSGAASSPTAIP